MSIEDVYDILVDGDDAEINRFVENNKDFGYCYMEDENKDRMHIRFGNAHIIAHGLGYTPNCVIIFGNKYGRI